MTKNKNLKENELNANASSNEEWDFSVSDTKIEIELEKSKKIEKKEIVNKVEKKLTLATPISKQNKKTMEQHYNELESKKMLDKDIIESAPINLRALALGIDVIFQFVLYIAAKKLVFIDEMISDWILEKNHLQWIIDEKLIYKLFFAINISILALLFVICPVLLYATSFGKKIAGLNIRGEKQYTLKIEKVIARELLIKPISMLLLFGFAVPFFNKEQKALHDILLDTIVVTDK